jgi:hypothetical protein
MFLFTKFDLMGGFAADFSIIDRWRSATAPLDKGVRSAEWCGRALIALPQLQPLADRIGFKSPSYTRTEA